MMIHDEFLIKKQLADKIKNVVKEKKLHKGDAAKIAGMYYHLFTNIYKDDFSDLSIEDLQEILKKLEGVSDE